MSLPELRAASRRWGFLLVEMVLIVSSILFAFALDSWWTARRELDHRTELLEALELDFETTRSRLATSIALADSLIARSRGFLAVAESEDPIPVDSIRFLAGGAFHAIPFEPALSAYRGAVATGDLGLIQSAGLLEALTQFDQGHSYYQVHGRITADLFYLGATWELRRELGSLRVLIREPEEVPSPLRMTDAEYRQLIRRPAVYAAVETVMTANENLALGLRQMDEAAARAIEEIKRIR